MTEKAARKLAKLGRELAISVAGPILFAGLARLSPLWNHAVATVGTPVSAPILVGSLSFLVMTGSAIIRALIPVLIDSYRGTGGPRGESWPNWARGLAISVAGSILFAGLTRLSPLWDHAVPLWDHAVATVGHPVKVLILVGSFGFLGMAGSAIIHALIAVMIDSYKSSEDFTIGDAMGLTSFLASGLFLLVPSLWILCYVFFGNPSLASVI